MGIIASLDIDAQKGFTPLPERAARRWRGYHSGGAQCPGCPRHPASRQQGCPPCERPWVVTEPGAMLQPLALANADLTWPAHCVPGTPGFELLDGLPAPSTTISSSGRGRAGPASLWRLLSRPGERRSTGLSSFCKPAASPYRAGRRPRHRLLRQDQRAATASRRFPVIVHLDACRGIAPETIDQARTRMIEAGAELAQTLADIQRLLDA